MLRKRELSFGGRSSFPPCKRADRMVGRAIWLGALVLCDISPDFRDAPQLEDLTPEFLVFGACDT